VSRLAAPEKIWYPLFGGSTALDKELSTTEAARNLEEYLDQVSQGDSILLTRDGKPIAEIRPVASDRRLGELPSLLASLPRLSPSEAKLLASDLEEIRASLFQPEARNPWGS
jgi:prevent-host-death family protein